MRKGEVVSITFSKARKRRKNKKLRKSLITFLRHHLQHLDNLSPSLLDLQILWNEIGLLGERYLESVSVSLLWQPQVPASISAPNIAVLAA